MLQTHQMADEDSQTDFFSVERGLVSDEKIQGKNSSSMLV